MIDDYTRGGQIFLHKIRMFRQVVETSIFWSVIIAIMIVGYFTWPKYKENDWTAARTYAKALFINATWEVIPKLNSNSKNKIPRIDTFDQYGQQSKQTKVSTVLASPKFKSSFNQSKSYIVNNLKYIFALTFSIIILIFLIWSKFGKSARTTKHVSGSSIKTAAEVRKYLHSVKRASSFMIGDMPLVKDSANKHTIVLGSTGSGKTNLFNILLPQVRLAKQPALVVDQTGEMISRYYDPERGDIIFNPLDGRSHSWDFWADVTSECKIGDIDAKLEKFAKVLFSFGKKGNNTGDPFWQNSAETVFVACAESLIKDNNKSLTALQFLLSRSSPKDLAQRLAGSKAARYLNENNKTTAASILSVMTTSTKPLNLLLESEKKFSLKQYFEQVKNGSEAWLFLSTAPEQREVTLPLIACLIELATSFLIGIGINEKRRIWFILDELSALGRLNSLATLLPESRKYGGCVLAATQSINQLLENFGHYAGSSIFGQFATKFIFRSDEPSTAKIISDIFGQVEYASQQRNTSYGAHEYRDGVSYTEHEKRKALITNDDLATLADLECFVGLPDPKVRIARLKLSPVTNVPKKNEGFVPYSNNRLININYTANYTSEGDFSSDISVESRDQPVSKNNPDILEDFKILP